MRIAAARGIPKKTATLDAIVEYENSAGPSAPEITEMKRTERGAKRIIWRRLLNATRMAQ